MQRRSISLLEALSNTALGFFISWGVWIPVQAFILHEPVSIGTGFVVTCTYTVVSIARNYIVRRLFNRHQHRRGAYCGRCHSQLYP